MNRSTTNHQTLPGNVRRALWRILPLIGGLHAYIGWRLLPAFGLDATGLALAIGGLLISSCLVPLGLLARFVVTRQVLADRLSWLGGVAMGLFSSVLVLTVLRDVARLVFDSPSLTEPTAMAVLGLAVLSTLIGYLNARRLASVLFVDIPLANLPKELAGFTIILGMALPITPVQILWINMVTTVTLAISLAYNFWVSTPIYNKSDPSKGVIILALFVNCKVEDKIKLI